jgi:hypothetical protein
MTWWMLGVMGLGLTASFPEPAQDAPAKTGTLAAWMTDYPAAKRLARQSGKPIFVVFR